MEAFTLMNHLSLTPDELSFDFGETALIFNILNHHKFYFGEINGKRGYIDVSKVQLKPCNWFYLSESSETGRARLECQPEGTFLVRHSEKADDEFRLMLKARTRIQQFRIERDQADKNFYLWPEYKFASVNKLIDYYKQYPDINGYPLIDYTEESMKMEVPEKKNNLLKSDKKKIYAESGVMIDVVDSLNPAVWMKQNDNGQDESLRDDVFLMNQRRRRVNFETKTQVKLFSSIDSLDTLSGSN